MHREGRGVLAFVKVAAPIVDLMAVHIDGEPLALADGDTPVVQSAAARGSRNDPVSIHMDGPAVILSVLDGVAPVFVVRAVARAVGGMGDARVRSLRASRERARGTDRDQDRRTQGDERGPHTPFFTAHIHVSFPTGTRCRHRPIRDWHNCSHASRNSYQRGGFHRKPPS